MINVNEPLPCEDPALRERTAIGLTGYEALLALNLITSLIAMMQGDVNNAVTSQADARHVVVGHLGADGTNDLVERLNRFIDAADANHKIETVDIRATAIVARGLAS